MSLPLASDFCAETSEAVGESIVGTAATVGVWLAIEHCPAWAYDAVSSDGIPESVREAVGRWKPDVAGLRVQLIRRPGTLASGTFRVYVVVAGSPGMMVRFDEMSFAALEALDLRAAVDAMRVGATPPGAEVQSTPLLLVCTHGKRDRCCAKRGMAIYEPAADADDIDVWQTTHLGGHRYAATCVVLPAGVCYGRVEPDDVPAMLDAHRGHRLGPMARVRGNCRWPKPVQAAEFFVREKLGETRLGVIELHETAELAAGAHRVELSCGGRRFEVDVIRSQTDAMMLPSCFKAPEPVVNFELVKLQERVVVR